MALFPPFSNPTAVGSKDALNPLIKQNCITKSNQMHFINLLQKMLTSQKRSFVGIFLLKIMLK